MKQLICITCPVGCKLEAELNGDGLTVTGHACKKGIDFAHTELTAPMRTLCTTVRIAMPGPEHSSAHADMTEGKAAEMLPVRTGGEIPKGAMMDVMRLLAGVTVTRPVKCGEVVASLAPVCEGEMIATCDWPFS